MASGEQACLRWNRVHQRRVCAGDGSHRNERNVYCEAQQAFFRLDECSSCPRFFAIDRSERDVFMICRDSSVDDRSRQYPRRAPKPTNFTSPDHVSISDIMTINVMCVTPETLHAPNASASPIFVLASCVAHTQPQPVAHVSRIFCGSTLLSLVLVNLVVLPLKQDAPHVIPVTKQAITTAITRAPTTTPVTVNPMINPSLLLLPLSQPFNTQSTCSR